MEIPNDAAFQRIDALPRRAYAPEQIAQLVSYYTSMLKTPLGEQTLRPVQAQALYEGSLCQGLLGPIGCGEGKTLVSLLMGLVVPCERYLLLVPAALKRKTQEELPEIGQHWQLPSNLRIRSYSEIAIESRAKELDEIAADVIFCDEAHRLKNTDAACTRRVQRYLEQNRHVRFYATSGTLMTDDIGDLLHLAAWALRERSPWPYETHAAFLWKAASKPSKAFEIGQTPHVRLGAIAAWPIDSAHCEDEKEHARLAMRKRALDTSGVVASSVGETYGGNIIVRPLPLKVPPAVDAHYKRLREDWTTPNGWALASPIELWSKARELALGFHYSWDPFAPRAWLAARSSYAFHVRSAIECSDRLDSERQVRTMLEQGEGDTLLREAWQAWREIEPSFTPNKIIIWHDRTALEACAEWARKSPGIVWVEHRDFGDELSRVSGLAFYTNDAEDVNGRHISKHPASQSLIASVQSCQEGQNLQAWNRNLLTAPRGKSQEQLYARTHRPGQLKDEVFFDAILACREHLEAVPKALAHAATIVSTIPNATQKILRADVSAWPEHYGQGYAYARNRGKPSSLADLLDELSDD